MGRYGTLVGLLVGIPVFAQEAPTQTPAQGNDLGQVVVQADAKAAALDSTSINTTINARDIVRFSDTNVGDVLRRQPGVIVEGYSAASANRVRLKGLGRWLHAHSGGWRAEHHPAR